MYNKREIMEKLEQFQPLSRKLLILINRLCTEPGVKVRNLFTVIEACFSEQPYQVQMVIDSLALGSWIEVVGDEIKAIDKLTDIISNIEIENDPMSEIMEKLVDLTTITPSHDIIEKVPYLRIGFAVLKYYQTKDGLNFEKDADLYGRLAINVAKFVGATNGIGGCLQLYDLPIYKILVYTKFHVEYDSTTYAQICLALACLHNQVFEYEGASRYIEEARKIAFRQGIADLEVEVFIAKSNMLFNQSLFGEALFYLKLAWDTNLLQHGEGCIENTEVVLKICDICIALRKKNTCREWFSKLNCNPPRHSELYILKTLVEAELYDEIEFGIQTFDEAEFISWRLFGFTQPYIYNRRSRYFDIYGLYEESNYEYGKFMRILRSLYGCTTNGDLVAYFSSRIMASLANGVYQTATQLNSLAIDLCPADGPQFSFGVRSMQYLSIASVYCYATHEYVLSCAYSEAVLEQIKKNIKMNNNIINQVREIFGSEKEIPASVFAVNLIRLAYRIKIDVALAEDHLENAKSLCLECLRMVHASDEECFVLSSLGYVYSKLGKIEDAIKTWKQAAKTSGDNALEIAAETSWFAYESGLLHVALEIINEATEKPTPSSASYSPFLTFARICGMAGLEDQKQAFYATARKLSRGRIQLSRCLYYEALDLQDIEAINRLERAVNCKADQGLCVDEELSFKWKALAENKDAIGLRKSAKTAALKAVRLYPADNPDIFEDIEDLLY